MRGDWSASRARPAELEPKLGESRGKPERLSIRQHPGTVTWVSDRSSNQSPLSASLVLTLAALICRVSGGSESGLEAVNRRFFIVPARGGSAFIAVRFLGFSQADLYSVYQARIRGVRSELDSIHRDLEQLA